MIKTYNKVKLYNFRSKNFRKIYEQKRDEMNEVVKRKARKRNSLCHFLCLFLSFTLAEFLDLILYFTREQRFWKTILKNSFAKIFFDFFAYEYECRMLTRLMLAYLLRFSIRGWLCVRKHESQRRYVYPIAEPSLFCSRNYLIHY